MAEFRINNQTVLQPAYNQLRQWFERVGKPNPKIFSDQHISRDEIVSFLDQIGVADGVLKTEDVKALENKMGIAPFTSFKQFLFRHQLDIFREAALEECKQNGFALEHVAEEYRGDEEIVLAAVRQAGWALKFASESLRANRKIVLEAVRQDGLAIQFADKQFLADREIVLLGVKANGMILKDVDPRFHSDREIVLEAVKENSDALEFAAPSLQADTEIVFIAVSQATRDVLQYADAKLRANREIVLASVQQIGYSIQSAALELQADRTIVLAAVKSHGLALQYVALSFRADREVVLVAVKSHGMALQYADEKFSSDQEIVLEAVKNDAEALAFAYPPLRNDPSFISKVEAVRNRLAPEKPEDNPYVFQPNPLGFTVKAKMDTTIYYKLVPVGSVRNHLPVQFKPVRGGRSSLIPLLSFAEKFSDKKKNTLPHQLLARAEEQNEWTQVGDLIDIPVEETDKPRTETVTKEAPPDFGTFK